MHRCKDTHFRVPFLPTLYFSHLNQCNTFEKFNSGECRAYRGVARPRSGALPPYPVPRTPTPHKHISLNYFLSRSSPSLLPCFALLYIFLLSLPCICFALPLALCIEAGRPQSQTDSGRTTPGRSRRRTHPPPCRQQQHHAAEDARRNGRRMPPPDGCQERNRNERPRTPFPGSTETHRAAILHGCRIDAGQSDRRRMNGAAFPRLP